MIDILLVDDQKILLEGLRKIFEPAPDIAVCAAGSKSAFQRSASS